MGRKAAWLDLTEFFIHSLKLEKKETKKKKSKM